MKPHRRYAAVTALLAFTVLMLVPAIALAAPPVAGSDTGAFERYLSEHGVGMAIAASFGAGFVASLTPCVFPMIPITVSIFGAKESTSRLRGAALSATFVLGIATLFTPLGVIAAWGGKSSAQTFLSNPYVLCGFAVLFIALASSMFGAFELALPASLNNRLSTVGGGGFAGTFVLGLVMGLVAAPCTGPFMTGLITWIFKQANEAGNVGQAVALGAGSMFAFSLGLGVLFFIAGTFAVSLPKAGAWMLGIKWVGGVVLAYMALRYLGQAFPKLAKLASQPSVPYGIIAGAVFLAGLVMGSIHIAAERRRSKIARLSRPMKLLSIVPAILGSFMFINWVTTDPIPAAAASTAPPLAFQTDEAAALAQAKADGKPLFMDFGATWCPGCMELEEKTFPDSRVREAGSRFVALKVDCSDDDAEGPEALQKKYHVVGLPTVIMLDRTGNEVARFNEFVPPDKFAAALEAVN